MMAVQHLVQSTQLSACPGSQHSGPASHHQQRTTSTSRLLSLPPEIRNLIYTALFTAETRRINARYSIPGLLLACQKTYNEAIGLHYSLSTFQCLEEDATVSWLSHLPQKYLDLIAEIKYDTRWIIFITPLIPVPAAECWLFQKLLKKLTEKGFDVNQLGHRVGEDGNAVGEGRLKVSFYSRKGDGGREIVWTDKPGLISALTA